MGDLTKVLKSISRVRISGQFHRIADIKDPLLSNVDFFELTQSQILSCLNPLLMCFQDAKKIFFFI